MPTVLYLDRPSLSGEAGPFTLFLRTRAGVLLNTGGDAISEIEVGNVKSGRWQLTVSESITEDLVARLYEGTTETPANILWSGWLPLGKTELQSEPPSSAGGTAVTLQLGATIPMNLGQVTGLDQDLVIGDSYTAAAGRRIPVTLTDASGNAVPTTFGTKTLADAGVSIKMLMHPANSRNTESVQAAAEGACEYVPASSPTPASLLVSLPETETAKLSPGVYSVQFHVLWQDGVSVTLAWKGTAKFVRRLKRKA